MWNQRQTENELLDMIEEEIKIKEKDENNPATIEFTCQHITGEKKDFLKDTKRLFDEIDRISYENPEISSKIMDQILSEPPNEE